MGSAGTVRQMIVELTTSSADTVVVWSREFLDCRLCKLLPCLRFYVAILTCILCGVLECAGGRPLFQDEKGNPLYSGWTGFDCSTPICVQVTVGLNCGVCCPLCAWTALLGVMAVYGVAGLLPRGRRNQRYACAVTWDGLSISVVFVTTTHIVNQLSCKVWNGWCFSCPHVLVSNYCDAAHVVTYL
jgi:hypothetical protein